jgi:hypothetical protein
MICVIKGQQQADLLSQHQLERVSILEKHFKEEQEKNEKFTHQLGKLEMHKCFIVHERQKVKLLKAKVRICKLIITISKR